MGSHMVFAFTHSRLPKNLGSLRESAPVRFLAGVDAKMLHQKPFIQTPYVFLVGRVDVDGDRQWSC